MAIFTKDECLRLPVAKLFIWVLCLLPTVCLAGSPAINLLLLSSTDKIKLVKSFSAQQTYYSLAPVVFDDLLWFSGVDEEHGLELWRSDGTPEGTVLASDINPGPEDSLPLFLTVYNNALYFLAGDNTNGFELRKTFWDSGISEYRTVLVKDIFPGAENGVEPDNRLIIYRGKLFFVANDGTFGREVWMSDGTATGTERVTDISPNAGDSDPRALTVLPGAPNSITGDILLFSANDGSSGRELWRINRTIIPPIQLTSSQVADICSGGCDSSPSTLSSGQGYTLYDGNLYFAADDGSHGKELWKTNGSAVGTSMVKDIAASGGISVGLGAEVFNGELFFSAREDNDGELWKTDGTTTVRVFNINTTDDCITLVNFVHNDSLYFSTAIGLSSAQPTTTLWRRYFDSSSMSWQSAAVADMILYPRNYLFASLAIDLGDTMYFTGLTFDESGDQKGKLIKLSGNADIQKIDRGIALGDRMVANGYVEYKNDIYFLGANSEHPFMLLKLSPR